MQTNACRPSEIITSLESAINLDFSLICICGKRLQKDVCENIRNISAKANKKVIFSLSNDIVESSRNLTKVEFCFLLSAPDRIISASGSNFFTDLNLKNNKNIGLLPVYIFINSKSEKCHSYELCNFSTEIPKETYININLDKPLEIRISGIILPTSAFQSKDMVLAAGTDIKLTAHNLLCSNNIEYIEQTNCVQIESNLLPNSDFDLYEHLKYYFMQWINSSQPYTKARLIRKFFDLHKKCSWAEYMLAVSAIYITACFKVHLQYLWEFPADFLKSVFKYIACRTVLR